MSKVNRVLIYCYYDKRGIVTKDVYELLRQFQEVTNHIIVVVNGKLSQNDLAVFCDKLYYRDNIGYDLGAYKYVLDQDEIRRMICNSDELILCNNSFWGPFVSVQSIFQRMSSSECDLWGITQVHSFYHFHIQSYWLVYRANVLHAKCFWEYWDQYVRWDYCFDDVLAVFENDLFHYLVEQGFSYDTYIKELNYDLYRQPFAAILENKVPIIKKKIIAPQFYNEKQIQQCLKILLELYQYNIDVIVDYIRNEKDEFKVKDTELDSVKVVEEVFQKEFKYNKVKEYIVKHKKLYIYGAGKSALSIYISFLMPRYIDRIVSFVVSDGVENINTYLGRPVIHISDLKCKDAPIIVALGKDNTMQVKEKLKQYINALFLY